MAQQEQTQLVSMRMWVQSLASSVGSGVAVSCGAGHRCRLDLALLWLWCRPADAALIPPLAWELQYATHTALKIGKTNKNRQFGSRAHILKP